MKVSNTEIFPKETKPKSVTFEIQHLKRPYDFLEEHTTGELLSKYSNNIIAHSGIKGKLVQNGFHSFLYGMYQAYAGHRPFVMSPDMIWLVICQGFSAHVKFGRGTENDVFPHLNTKQSLVIRRRGNEAKNSSFWEELPGQFASQIGKHLNAELVETLRADFSTTKAAEKIASEITIMDSVKPYFEFIPMESICGIPEITIEGSEKDWLKIIDKITKLRRYNLDWWVDKLEPLIKEFALACKGEVKKEFWKNMFKIHKGRGCMGGEFVDGWITSFYPYDRFGRLMHFKDINTATEIEKIMSVPFKSICDELPKEIACVDFTWEIVDEHGEVISATQLEYWGGFLGLRQNKENFSLTPEIGWFVCHKDEKIKNGNTFSGHEGLESRKYFNLDQFPREVLSIPSWENLGLNYRGKIDLPDEILKLSIQYITLNGDVTPELKTILSKLVQKQVKVYINGKEYEASHPA